MSRPHFQSEIRFHRPPITWAVQRLIVLNVCIFALQLLIEPIEQLILPRSLEQTSNLFIILGFSPMDFLSGRLWQPLTYQFLHGGILHLFLNMLWLFIFGPDVERTLGTRQFYKFYLVCGIFAVMLTFLSYFMYGRDPSVVGASGAIMGVLVAYAVIDPEREFFLFPLPFPINARALVIIVIFMNIISALGHGNNVSVATHFGGMITGYVYMALRPKFAQWQLQRRKSKIKPEANEDKVGDAVNNIFNFKDHD